jgi:hypothetical protein
MSQSDIIAPILSYDDINKRAEDFLEEHKRNEILPVDIEAIAEFDLGLNIFPFPNLQETFDIEGFISGDLNVIYVDEFIYYQRPARYRFTLAPRSNMHLSMLLKQVGVVSLNDLINSSN